MARRRHSNQRRRRGSFGFLYKLLSMLVICAAIIVALTLFFRVDTVKISGKELTFTTIENVYSRRQSRHFGGGPALY